MDLCHPAKGTKHISLQKLSSYNGQDKFYDT